MLIITFHHLIKPKLIMKLTLAFFSQGLDGAPGASGSPGLPGAKVCFLLDPWEPSHHLLFRLLNNSILKRGTQCVCAYNFNFCTAFWLICIENNTLARGDMKFLFMCSTSYLRSERSERREISYLQAAMYYFIYYINALLTIRSRLHSRFIKRTRSIHSSWR